MHTGRVKKFSQYPAKHASLKRFGMRCDCWLNVLLYALQGLEFTENGVMKKTHTASVRSVGKTDRKLQKK